MPIKTNISKWILAAILLFTALLYRKAILNDFAWDDGSYIIQNPYITDFSFNGIKNIFLSFYSGNYHPLTMLTFLLEYSIFKTNPLPYHLVNIAIHLLNIWLVFKVTQQLSGNKTTALIVSFLFAVHPMHVESVAWISELKDVLYSAFYLLSLIVYLRYIKSAKKIKLYIGSLLLFVASLLSKSAAVTLPVLLLAVDIYKGRKINTKMFLEKVPFILLSLFFGILAIFSQRVSDLQNNLSFTYYFFDKIFLFAYSLYFYIVKIIAPFNLSAIHYFPDNHEGMLPWMYYAALPFIILIAFLIYKIKSSRKEILFGFAFFLITVSVMLYVPVGNALTAERYTYIPYLGLFYIAGQWISNIEKNKFRNIAIVIFSLFAIMFSYQTWSRIRVWKNGEVLFTDVIKKNPKIFHGYWARGNVKMEKGDAAGSLQDFNKAIQLKPDFAELYNNRGNAYKLIGDINSALLDYNKAVKLNPEFAITYKNRGLLRASIGKTDSAMLDINKAISKLPQDAETYIIRGYIKALQKDYNGSVSDFSYSLKLRPENVLAYYNRGISYFNMNDTANACEDWRKAASLGSDAAAQAVKKYCN